MRKSFEVFIKHDGKPLRGVRVNITVGEVSRFSASTNADGKVQIESLPPGEYWLHTDFLGIGAGSECFHIRAKGSWRAKKRFMYTWGDWAPGVSRISGRIVDLEPSKTGTPLWNLLHPVTRPISDARISIYRPDSEKVYELKSDADGNFALQNIPSGTYVLYIEGGQSSQPYEGTYVLVNVVSGAKYNQLLLTRSDKGGGGCGDTSLGTKFSPSLEDAPN